MFSESKVGDKVYIEVRVSDKNKEGIESHKISKVGRKYIYVDRGLFKPVRYSKTDGKHMDTHYKTGNLHLSPNTIKDSRERSKLANKIWEVLYHSRPFDLTLYQLRMIDKILEEKREN